MSKMISCTEDGKILLNENMNVRDVTEITFACLMNLYKGMVNMLPEEEKEKCTEEMYDYFNSIASGFLQMFAPEIEMRPDLTAEAIMEMENQLLKEKVAEANEELKEKMAKEEA